MIITKYAYMIKYKTFLIKYAEIGVKGKNRYLFEDALVRRIEEVLRGGGDFRVTKTRGRIYVDAPETYDYDETIRALQRVFGVLPVTLAYGRGNPDSNKVDSAGNLYQAMMHAGHVLVLNPDGIPVGNVVVPGREQGRLLNTPNLAIEPGKDMGYLVASDERDVVVLEFPTLAPGMALYSHL